MKRPWVGGLALEHLENLSFGQQVLPWPEGPEEFSSEFIAWLGAFHI